MSRVICVECSRELSKYELSFCDISLASALSPSAPSPEFGHPSVFIPLSSPPSFRFFVICLPFVSFSLSQFLSHLSFPSPLLLLIFSSTLHIHPWILCIFWTIPLPPPALTDCRLPALLPPSFPILSPLPLLTPPSAPGLARQGPLASPSGHLHTLSLSHSSSLSLSLSCWVFLTLSVFVSLIQSRWWVACLT